MRNQEKSMLEVIEEEQEQLVLSNKEIIDYLSSNILQENS